MDPIPLPNDEVDPVEHRNEKSLGLLTRRFVTLIKSKPEGVVSLKGAQDELFVVQKRRIYDITNVLEGIGLIEKYNKNCVQWKGTFSTLKRPRPINKEQKKEIAQLKKQELRLDKIIHRVRRSLAASQTDPANKPYAYVTQTDLHDSFGGDQTVMTIKNHSKLYRPGILQRNIILSRSLLVTSLDGGPLDVRLVSGERLEVSTNAADAGEAAKENHNGNAEEKTPTPPRKRRRTDDEDDNESDPELEYEARIVLGDAASRQYRDRFAAINPPLIPLMPPVNSDYRFCLAPTEGVLDLFDIPSEAPLVPRQRRAEMLDEERPDYFMEINMTSAEGGARPKDHLISV